MEPWVWGWIAAVGMVAAAIAVARGPQRAVGPAAPDVDERVGRWLLGAVIAGGVALHAPGLAGAFTTFDDPRQILDNPVVTELTREHVLLVLNNYYGQNQELMYLSFQLNWFVAGDTYWAWYLPNLVVFAAIVALVHRLAWHLLGHRAGAALAAAIFATAPVTSELLCWMSARSHLLGLLFALASVVAWFESTTSGRRRHAWLVASVAAFALSQGCKSIFLFVPAWLVLFDLFRGRRAWAEKVPYFLIVPFFLGKAVRGASEYGRLSDDLMGDSYTTSLLSTINFVAEYARSAVIPYETGLLPHRIPASGWWGVQGVADIVPVGFAPAASLVTLVAIGAIALAMSRRWGWHLPLLVVAGSAVSLVTVLNVPWRGPEAAFEYRYTLSAHVLVAVLLSGAVVRARAAWSGEIARVGLVAAAGAYVAVAAHANLDNTLAWRTPASYWVRNAELYPNDFDAHYLAAKALGKQKLRYAALQHLHIAASIRKDKNVYRRMADNYDALGFADLARANYLRYYSRNRNKVGDYQRKRFAALGITDALLDDARQIPVHKDPWILLRDDLAATTPGMAMEGEAR